MLGRTVECSITGMKEAQRAAITGIVVSVDRESLKAVISDSSGEASVIIQEEMLPFLREGEAARITGVPFFDSEKMAIEAEVVQGMAGIDLAFYKKALELK